MSLYLPCPRCYPSFISLLSLSRSLTLLSFLVLLTLINTVCCHIHIWATLSGCRPCSQLEMPVESESVLWRPRSPRQLSPWQTSSGYAPSQSSPLTFIRDSVNVKPASDCSLIRYIILLLSLFKHSILSQSRGFIPDALSHLYTHPPFSLLHLFSYSLSPSWWMSSLDATLTCVLRFTCLFFLLLGLPTRDQWYLILLIYIMLMLCGHYSEEAWRAMCPVSNCHLKEWATIFKLTSRNDFEILLICNSKYVLEEKSQRKMLILNVRVKCISFAFLQYLLLQYNICS